MHYPAKPYVVPFDDWFNDNSSNFENKSKAKESRSISTIHEFFYKQSYLKIGGSDNLIQTTLEKKLSAKPIISSHRNPQKSVSSRKEEKFNYFKMPTSRKLIKKRSFQEKIIYKTLSKKNIFNLKLYLLDLKSVFIKIISRK